MDGDLVTKASYEPVGWMKHAKNLIGQTQSEFHNADTSERGPCRICGRPGAWVSGCGSYMCSKHQDDY